MFVNGRGLEMMYISLALLDNAEIIVVKQKKKFTLLVAECVVQVFAPLIQNALLREGNWYEQYRISFAGKG